jgi:gluconolactonase
MFFMRTLFVIALFSLALMGAEPMLLGQGGGENKPIAGIGPTGPIKKLHTGFGWAEGPIADGKGNVYFSDLAGNKIHKIDADGKISVYSDKLKGPNGLMFNTKGELVACEMGAGRIVAFEVESKKMRVVADTYEGKGFGGPNDLVTDLHGGLYFTDYRLVKGKQDKMGVYYVDADGKVTRLVDNLRNPNGIILSTDEKILYVIPSGQPEIFSYPVEGPGKIGPGKVFCKLVPATGRKANPMGDGVAIDTKGNLYFTADKGIQVFNPKGEHLGTITFPEAPANVDFGGPEFKTLIVTARTSVYTVPMEAVGHRFGKK